MKIFINTCACDLKRTLVSRQFFVAAIGLSMVTIITMFDELAYMQPGTTTIVYINLIEGYLDFHMVYLLFAAIPGATLFCSDWDNRFIRFSVMRCSKIKYAVSKAIACFFSAIAVVFVAEWMTIFVFSMKFPLFNASEEFDYGAYILFATSDKIFGYFMVRILCKAFCAGFLCVFALWFSTKIINVFVALATPLLAYYLISTLSFALKLPTIFQISYLSKGYINIENKPLLSFGFTVLLFTVATIVFGFCFIRSCRRRIENG